jgi:hypothetical protein
MKMIMQLFSMVVLSMIYVISILSYPCQADWEMVNISKGGYYNSIAIDPSGHPHLSYLDDSNPTNFVLKHAYFDGNAWKKETVDSGDVGSWNSIAIDSLGHIHISYNSPSSPLHLSPSLKYAYFDGENWNLTNVDAGGYSTSIAIDSTNYPHISYINAGLKWVDSYSVFLPFTEVKYAKYDGAKWITETIAENAFSNAPTSIVLNASNKAYISFTDSSLPLKIYLANNSSGTWKIECLGDGGGSSLALDSFDNPHIVYLGGQTRELKYSYYDGSAWNTYTAPGVLADSPHIALDSINHPHISLGVTIPVGDTSAECLFYVDFDGTNLNGQPLDCGRAGYATSIALDDLGFPHISYRLAGKGESSSLRSVHLTMPDLTGQWTALTQSCKNSTKGSKCTIKGTLNIQNIGNANVKSALVRIYLSDNPYYDEGDPLLKQVSSAIKVNGSKNKKFSYTFPLNATASQKYIIAVIDQDNTISELNESNNYIVSELIP